MAKERLIDEDARKLTREELEFQNRVKGLINKAEQAITNTEYLLERLEDIIDHMKKEGISKVDLEKFIELSSEYNVPYTEILIDTVDKKRSKKRIDKYIRDIDNLFAAYKPS